MIADSRIQILPEDIAGKIAAGEVVQRPASVVKELLENSLDAGATTVVVSVAEGGKSEIMVSDDGSGMTEDDIQLSVVHHATSKISDIHDLESLSTYGFRGEALPSIAAVAHLVIKSRIPQDDSATVLEVRAGQRELTREGREPGTQVIVRNLFYNIPARRKFLRSRATEFRHIHEVVQRLALARPDVAFEFLSDGKSVLNLPAQTSEERIVDLFGDHLFSGLVEVRESSDEIGVRGFVSKPTFAQRARAQQFLFLNDRYIVSRNINHAVFSAYEHLMIKGSYPFFALFLTVDPARVDVNVHPSKLEVKFADEGAVYRFVHTLIRKSIGSAGFVPAVSLTGGGVEGEERLRFTSRQHLWPVATETRISAAISSLRPGTPEPDSGYSVTNPRPPIASGETESEPPTGFLSAASTGPVWQIHRKYIILQTEHGLVIIDQHVAHERVLYERILDRFARGERSGQQLLFPRTFRVHAGDKVLLNELMPFLDDLGFSIRPFGGDTFIVESAPAEATHGAEETLVIEMLSQYREEQQGTIPEPRDAVAKSFSCRAAVKAGSDLTEHEMRSLITQLFRTRMPFVCPHGRPTVLRVSIDELDRRFGRTS